MKMARVWLAFGVVLASCVSPSYAVDERQLRGGRAEDQSLVLKPGAHALTGKAKKPKSTSPIEDINATAVSMVTNANSTMYSVLDDVMSSFDAFSDSVGEVNSTVSTLAAAVGSDAVDSVVAFVASVSNLVDEAREELSLKTIQRQTALRTKWATFDSLAAKAVSAMEVATMAVDKVVQDAKGLKADDSGPQVLLQMKCCSGSGEAATNRGIWDWVKGIFGGGSSPCGKAQESISSLNATIDKLSEGLHSTNVSVSEDIHEWGNAVEARVQVLQADVNSTGTSTHGMLPKGVGPKVSKALEAVPVELTEALKDLYDADLKAVKSLKKSGELFQAAYAAVNDLDLQATAACALKAAAKKKTNAAPCDHHC